jgi:hypothetical protein
MPRRGRNTISESVFSDKHEFVELVKNWRPDGVTVLLNLVWEGFDLYKNAILSRIDLSQSDDQLERDITQSLSIYIEQASTKFEPFVIRTEFYEMELREPSPARPKQYDLAFVWSNPPNVRIIWPLEAKLLQSDGSVSKYINEIKDNYLTCRYSPFSSEAGMLGYLLKGEPQKAFDNIEKSLEGVLSNHPDFPNREHRTSDHQRKVPLDKNYPSNFRCHHLLLKIVNEKLLKQDILEKPTDKNI